MPLLNGIVALLLALPCVALAQATASDTPTRLAPVVVTATRTEESPFNVPASIDRVGGNAIRDGRPQINISESLGGVPGLFARDRQNYAQDVQISIRGFGARSTFGIRGVRLYVDGIPATLPDGQGQISNVDLGSAERIEVLRGPFSALYGNSSGGVIQVFTEEGRGVPTASASVAGASFGTGRAAVKAAGGVGDFGYVVSGSVFHTHGYREHSAAERRIGNGKLTWQASGDDKLTLVVNSVALPEADDPLGLSRAQFAADPRSVDPTATQFNTRKTIDQTQVGLVYERRLDGANAIRALVYDGHRNTEQFQAIAVAAQASPLYPGGVIALGRDYRGGDLRWTTKARLAGEPFTLVAGLAYDTLGEHRRGFQNFVGTTLGVEGALRRDEDNDVRAGDEYLQLAWRPAEHWTIDAGVRHSDVRFVSTDHYIVGTNPDDSGQVRYSATLPVLGVLFAASDAIHLYATAGRGFETPTLNELAYRPNGATGLNLQLGAAKSASGEVGIKTRIDELGEATLAFFHTRTDDEIATLSNVGGRSTYQNVGATRRRGIEAAWSRDFADNLHAQAAYTLLDARYLDAFATCTAAPCAAPNVNVAAGNRIPGVARQALFAALAWAPPAGWQASIEGRVLSRVWVNDANTDAAAGFAVVNLGTGYRARVGAWALGGFARADNVLGRRYAGSVIVNEGNGRYFEPAPGRNWTVGVAAAASF